MQPGLIWVHSRTTSPLGSTLSVASVPIGQLVSEGVPAQTWASASGANRPAYSTATASEIQTADFRMAKGRIRELADEKARAERARRRFEARNQRLEREQREREEELARQKETAKAAGPDAIAEILKRKQRKDEDETS